MQRRIWVGLAVAIAYAVCVSLASAGPVPDGLPAAFTITGGGYSGDYEWSEEGDSFAFVSGTNGVDAGSFVFSPPEGSGALQVGGEPVLEFGVYFPGGGAVESTIEGVSASVPESGGALLGFFLIGATLRLRRRRSPSSGSSSSARFFSWCP
jgi:hypothetical protein